MGFCNPVRKFIFESSIIAFFREAQIYFAKYWNEDKFPQQIDITCLVATRSVAETFTNFYDDTSKEKKIEIVNLAKDVFNSPGKMSHLADSSSPYGLNTNNALKQELERQKRRREQELERQKRRREQEQEIEDKKTMEFIDEMNEELDILEGKTARRQL